MNAKNTAGFLVLAAICGVINALAILTWNSSYITNDGVQYLSTAANWINGRGFSTDALIYGPHFQALLPAPQTVWPPGYSFALGLIGSSGLDLHWAGLFLNLTTHALAALLVFLILRRMALSPAYSTISALLFYLMAMPWSFVSGIITEPLFTTLLLGATIALPDPRRSGLPVWLICGLLMAMAIYVRYSAVFFASGVGIGLFLYVILYDRPGQLRHLIPPVLKIGVLLIAPVLAFLHLMYRTRALTGTLDRYSGFREPETFLSTLRIWIANSSELLGLGHGELFSTNVRLTIFFTFICLVTFLFALFLARAGTNQQDKPNIENRYNKVIMLVIISHSIGLITYLTISSMSDTPLNIVTRYLYQIYFGLYLLFCFAVFHLLQKREDRANTRSNYVVYIPLTGIIAIYLFAQINELSTSRAHFFEEGRRTQETMLLSVDNDNTVADYISNCFPDNDGTVIWSTHGQQVHLHTGKSTITHADIYTSMPFKPDLVSQRVTTYNIGMFLFIGDQQLHDDTYQRFMHKMKQWVVENDFKQVFMLENTVRGDKKVDIFIDDSKCTTQL